MFGEKAILRNAMSGGKKLAKTQSLRNFINEKPGRGKKDDFPAVVMALPDPAYGIQSMPSSRLHSGIRDLQISPNGLDLSAGV